MSHSGRFAPSPSGRLHLGSLVTAYASHFCARAQHSSFVLRIEDLDFPRCKASNLVLMLRELMALGLHSDQDILVQGHQLHSYSCHLPPEAFYCSCTREQLKERPCPCANLKLAAGEHRALRLDLSRYLTHYPSFMDHNLGRIQQKDYELAHTLTLLRADGIVAYNLAVVLDDHKQGIEEVVRGSDMLEASFLQLALYEIFGYAAPEFLHIPVLVDSRGIKLSKQNHATPALDLYSPVQALEKSFALLGQDCAALTQEWQELKTQEQDLHQRLKTSAIREALFAALHARTLAPAFEQELKKQWTDALALVAAEVGSLPLPKLAPAVDEELLSPQLQALMRKRHAQEQEADMVGLCASLLDDSLCEQGRAIHEAQERLLTQMGSLFRSENLPQHFIEVL